MFAIASHIQTDVSCMIGTGNGRRPQQILGTTLWSIENGYADQIAAGAVAFGLTAVVTLPRGQPPQPLRRSLPIIGPEPDSPASRPETNAHFVNPITATPS
jgi:hypothetical protein